jgi:hypothetical protein
MELDFDIDEFLAYLLPGALIVILARSVATTDAVRDILDLKLFEPEFARTLIGVSAYLGASLAAGHVASVWTRFVVQPLVRAIFGNPQSAVFGQSDSHFYTPQFRKLVHDKFNTIFNAAIDSPGMRGPALQMIRAHVLRNSSAAITVRERVVRARSLCGNMTLPVILFALLLFHSAHVTYGLVLLAIAVLLAAKQHLLDQREYRSINSFFVST